MGCDPGCQHLAWSGSWLSGCSLCGPLIAVTVLLCVLVAVWSQTQVCIFRAGTSRPQWVGLCSLEPCHRGPSRELWAP